MNPFAEKVASALMMKGVEFSRVVIDEADEIKRVSPETQLLPVIEYRGRTHLGFAEDSRLGR